MPTIFISHQKSDRSEARKIAEYLRSMHLDVYFDEFDQDLQDALKNNNPKGVVNAIKKGINKSSHMLCLISPNTLYSKWVPFEVGFGYNRTNLFTLTLKGIKDSELPDYIKTAPIIRDIYDLNKFIEKRGKRLILEVKSNSNYDNSYHPLRSVMDRIIT